MSFAFGSPQAPAASPGFGFGAANPQPTIPVQQSVAPLTFGTATPSAMGPMPAVALPATATTASGLTFGMSAPPYGSQLPTSAAPSLTFGLGTAATTKYVESTEEERKHIEYFPIFQIAYRPV